MTAYQKTMNTYVYKKPEWKMRETDKSSGSGKTYDAKEHYDDKTIAFTFTNKASDVLVCRGVDNSHTFDSFFTEQAHNKPLHRLEAYNRIIVDEFSMVPSKFYTLLMQIKTMYPMETVINVNQLRSYGILT